MRQPHEIDFNCISINLILSPWKCYVSDYDWLCWDCDENDTHTHWFHNEQLNYMLSVAFQSKVLIFTSFDTFLSMRLHWIISFMVFFFSVFLSLSFLIRKSCSEWLSLHVPIIHSTLYDINLLEAANMKEFQCVTNFLRICKWAIFEFNSKLIFVLCCFALCIHISSSPRWHKAGLRSNHLSLSVREEKINLAF